MSKSVQSLKPFVTKRSFPFLSSTPSKNIVTPGVGHITKQTSYIVGLPGYNDANQITKKLETTEVCIITIPCKISLNVLALNLANNALCLNLRMI